MKLISKRSRTSHLFWDGKLEIQRKYCLLNEVLGTNHIENKLFFRGTSYHFKYLFWQSRRRWKLVRNIGMFKLTGSLLQAGLIAHTFSCFLSSTDRNSKIKQNKMLDALFLNWYRYDDLQIAHTCIMVTSRLPAWKSAFIKHLNKNGFFVHANSYCYRLNHTAKSTAERSNIAHSEGSNLS